MDYVRSRNLCELRLRQRRVESLIKKKKKKLFHSFGSCKLKFFHLFMLVWRRELELFFRQISKKNSVSCHPFPTLSATSNNFSHFILQQISLVIVLDVE